MKTHFRRGVYILTVILLMDASILSWVYTLDHRSGCTLLTSAAFTFLTAAVGVFGDINKIP